jgi:MarR family transcriptional regulator for hemolysin
MPGAKAKGKARDRTDAASTAPRAAAMDWDAFATPAPLINMASRALTRIAERRLRPFGVSAGQVPVLYLLRDGRAMSQKDLARCMHVEQPSMAQMLARMERDGLIRRTPDRDDGRSSLISLTKAAIAKLPGLRKELHAGQEEMVAGFSDAEITNLCDLLRRLNHNLDRIAADENT